MEMPVYLALGSNMGDKQQNIEMAYCKIEERIGRIASTSAFYFSRPQGFESEHSFVNSACEVNSFLDIFTIFSHTRSIEQEMGRSDKSNGGVYVDRIIDIDLLLAGDLVMDTIMLTIPHPRMHLRDFVIEPLCEIAPDVVHPIFHKTIYQLKRELDTFK